MKKMWLICLTFFALTVMAQSCGTIRVACIGNSITEGFGIDSPAVYSYPAQLQNIMGKGYCVRNFGLSARTMLLKGDCPYMKEPAWQEAQAFKADVVIIKLGTNDSKPHNWQHGAEFRHDLEQMITTLLPDKPEIFLCTPIPAFKSTWDISDSVIVNGIIPVQQEMAEKYGLHVIDLHTLYANDGDKMLDDGIHPNARGARRLAEIISTYIKK